MNEKIKEEALAAGKAVHNSDFVEIMIVILEESSLISGGRAAELIEMVTHLLKCRKVCEEYSLMRDVTYRGDIKIK